MTPAPRVLILCATTLAVTLVCTLALTPYHPTVRAQNAPITYSRQIAPIIYKNCSSCHHEGGAGPFSLTSYAQVKRWASTIQTVTQTRYMPPWLPEPGFGDFADSRRLSTEDISLLAKWVAAGIPEGNPAEAPPPPVYNSTWQLGPPDLILKVDSPMVVPASGTDLFRNFILPVPITQTRYIRAMEIKPGSPRVVHHANVIIDRTASLRRLHPDDWKQGIPGMDISIDAGNTFDPDSHFLFWKPDSAALVEPPNMPWRLDPGNDLILNMHLKPTGKPETIQATIALYFAAAPATQHPMLLQLEHDDALNIPPNDPAFLVEDQLTLPIDLDVLGIYPHAHYLGKIMKGYAILPNGSKRWLVYIKNWDINRQSVYRFATPVFLPKGSTIHMQYTYDNSAANPRNPNTPPIAVHNGNRSVDEMGHLWLQVLPRPASPGQPDPRLALEQAWMQNRLRKDPNDATALYNLASLESTTGHPTAAVTLYQRTLQQHAHSNDPRILTALGSAYDAAGEWQKARDQYTAALTADPAYSDARYDLAQLDLHHDDYTAAEQQFQTLIAANPQDAGAHIGLAQTLLATQRRQLAEQQLRTALQLDPNSFDALYNLGVLTLEDGRTSESITLLERALQQKEDPDAHQSLALSYAQQNRLADAIAQLQASLHLRPDDPEPHRAMAQLYSQMGQLANAIHEQTLATTNNPDDWNDLGVMQARAGNKAAARQDFQHALTLNPNHAAAKANLSHLQPTQ